ncbi:MAG: hypothetical protein U9R15_05520 [Chloroflexota bacterium]|nr:hypothetical protein [Chloroflexota bacterium]
MRGLIRPHQELLCFFAQASGYRRCVLGLNFDEYDPTDGSVPVLVMERAEAKVMLEVHGRRFKRAYERSRCGKSLVVTFTFPSSAGWFQMGWKLDSERVMSERMGTSGVVGFGDLGHNPVVAYLLVDETYSVIGPPGEEIDPAFYCEEDALGAAEVYGREDEVCEVIELYLEGILNVVFQDVGDIMVDGRTAERFVEACTRKGLRTNAEEEIDTAIRETRYSCRELLGE